MNLRDALLAALTRLPGTREFHIHVLVSSPRKHWELFPYAHPRPRVCLQDTLVLLSEQATPDSPRVLVTAIDVTVYHIPATSCIILYVGKVDSTGQGAAPSPTATLIKALLTYYADPATRPIHADTIWIQLFARSQGQYLFPNSSEYPGKRVLSDAKLCAWWKRVLEEVLEEVSARSTDAKMGLYYVLPGFSELEAINSLHIPISRPHSSSSQAIGWTYGHQYTQTDIPLPCPPPKGAQNLGHYIPWFDDDPKSRFLDEIAYTNEAASIQSPDRKRTKPLSRQKSNDLSVAEQDEETNGVQTGKLQGELGKVSAQEFWERMSFRQECVSGAVTGFFSLGITSPHAASEQQKCSQSSPLAPHPGHVSDRLLHRVVQVLMKGHEYSTTERAIRATESLEATIKGLCEDIVAVTDTVSKSPLLSPQDGLTENKPPTTNATLDVPRTPPQKSSDLPPESPPNTFAEPTASLETYSSHIYGSILVKNPPLDPKTSNTTNTGDASGSTGDASSQKITVLAVRKKRKVQS